MFAAIDKHINNFNKGFLTSAQGGHEDPTYVGFRFVFDFDPVSRNIENAYTADPLFSERAELESAQRYLRANGYHERANALVKFKEILRSLVNDTPWYFQTLEGLGNIWKIKQEGEFNPYRGKGLELTVTCLESIDMRITALADLYRKATFDGKYMRELLPENLKWFSVVVQVAEIRSFQKVASAVGKVNTAQQITNANTQTTTNSANSAVDLANGFPTIEDVDGLVSILEFKLGHCEFDFSDSFLVDGPIAMGGGDMSMAKQSFKIRPRIVKEQNNYSLMGLVLSEGPDEGHMHIAGKTDTSGFNNVGVPKELDKAFNPRSPLGNVGQGGGTFNPVAAAAANLKTDLQRKIESSGANLIGKATGAVQQAVNGQLLGNVYDLRNQSAQTIFNSFVGKNQQTAISPLGKEDVYPNVPGSDINTKTEKNIGNAITPSPTSNTNLGPENIFK